MRRTGTTTVAFLAAGLLVFVALPAAGQATLDSANEEQKQAARDGYAAGKTAFEAKQYDEALASFEQSYVAVASPNTKLMIARCLAQLSRNAEAYEAYGATMGEAEASGDLKYQPAGRAAESERAALSAHVGMVKVFVGGDPSGASLAIQGREVPAQRVGDPVAVDPGPIEVVLTRADGTTDTRAVTVVAGQMVDVEVDATPLPPPEPAFEPMVDEEPADEDEDERLTDRANTGIVLGGKIGLGLGKPMSEFGASYVLELELGWMLPVLDRGLEVFVSGQYTRPKITDIEGEPDARLPGDGIPRAEITQDELALTLGALYRLHVGLDWLAPYGGAGARLYMQRTTVEGNAGERFGSNEETQSDVGLLLLGGVDFGLGPGALLAELQFGWAKLDGFILRDTNAGALRLLVGYRAML